MSDKLCLGVTRSICGRKWTYRHNPEALESYASKTGLPLLEAALLSGRNVEPESVQAFLSPRLKTSLPNPSDLVDVIRLPNSSLIILRKGSA